MNPSHPKTPMYTLRIWLVMLFTLLLASCGSSPQSPADPPAQFGDRDLANAKLELPSRVLDANSTEFGQAMQKTQAQIEKLESGRAGEIGAQAVLPGAAGFLYYKVYNPILFNNPYAIAHQDQTSGITTNLYKGSKTIDSVAGTLYGNVVYASIHDGNDYEIYRVNASTNVVTKLTDDSVDNTYVTSDKTGKVLAWQVPGAGGKSEIRLRIYDINDNFTEATLSGDVPYRHPRINRNARRMVYVQDDLNDSITLKRLYNMDIAPQVLFTDDHLTDPSIDDDGTRIAFLQGNGIFDFLRVVHVDTGQVEFQYFAAFLQHPSITADGRWLAFAEKTTSWRIRTVNLITKTFADATAPVSPTSHQSPHWEKPRPFPTTHGLLKTFAAQTDGQAGLNVDLDGDWMVVSARLISTVHVLKRNGLQWEVATQLFANGSGKSFGSSVAISGDTVMVGAPSDGKGAVYIFQRNQGGSNNWGKVTKITSSDLNVSGFGNSVDIAGDLAVVAPTVTSNGGSRVYIYGRNQGGDNKWGIFTSKDFEVATVNYEPVDVAVADDKVAVGVPGEKVNGVKMAGAVYLYARNTGGSNTFGLLKHMTAETQDQAATLGFSVAMTADTLVAGAPNANAAYVYERNNGGNNAWGKVKTLKASDQQSGDRFGHSVDVGLNTYIVVGAPHEDGEGINRGAAYVFRQLQGGASMWGEVSRLTGYELESLTNDGDNFGASVATSSSFIVVGIPGLDKNKQNQGGIYTFKE